MEEIISALMWLFKIAERTAMKDSLLALCDKARLIRFILLAALECLALWLKLRRFSTTVRFAVVFGQVRREETQTILWRIRVAREGTEMAIGVRPNAARRRLQKLNFVLFEDRSRLRSYLGRLLEKTGPAEQFFHECRKIVKAFSEVVSAKRSPLTSCVWMLLSSIRKTAILVSCANFLDTERVTLFVWVVRLGWLDYLLKESCICW